MKFLTGLVLVRPPLLIACTPVINQRGYLADPDSKPRIKPGTDTKTSVQDRLGYASTTATFGGDAWYYISSTEKQVAFFTPTVLNRAASWRSISTRTARSPACAITACKDGHVIAFEDPRDAGARPRTHLPAATAERQARRQRPNAIQQTNPGGGGGPPTSVFNDPLRPSLAALLRSSLRPPPPPALRARGSKPVWLKKKARARKARAFSFEFTRSDPDAPASPAAAAPRCW